MDRWFSDVNLICRVLVVFSLALGAASAAKVIIYTVKAVKIPGQIENAVEASKQDEDSVKKLQEKYKEAAAVLKKKSIFSPPPPGKSNPVKSVEAILGKEALINNAWYKAGDTIGQAKVIAVEAAEVVIEWEGKKTRLAPIAAPVKYEACQKPERQVKPVKEEKPQQQAAVKAEVIEEKPAPAVEEDPLAWMGVKMSAKLKAKMLEKWNQATPQEKEQWKKQWNSMPESQKQQAVDGMEQHVDKM